MSNVNSSYRTGIELVAGILPIEKVRWDLNITLSRNRIREYVDYVDDWDNWPDQASKNLGETDLSFSPSVISGSNLRYEPLDGLSVSLLTKFVGKQYIDNTSSADRMLDAYSVSNISLGYTLMTKIIKSIDFKFLVNNVFNEEYETNAWVYRYQYGGTKITSKISGKN